MRVHKSKSSSSGKLKKRLPYNFKQLSKQIQQAKTADAARPVVQKMRTKLSWLYKQLRNGEYGADEIFAAIIHAASMERIAKRKVRHLEEETSRSCSSAAYVDCSRSGSVGEAADAKVCRGNVQWKLLPFSMTFPTIPTYDILCQEMLIFQWFTRAFRHFAFIHLLA